MSPVSDGMAAAILRAHPNAEQTPADDPFEATAQTVRYMARLVAHSLSDPILFNATSAALRIFAITGSPSAAIWQWCKRNVKFVHHSKLLESWLGKGDELQLLISPEALLRMERPKGDCAVFTTLVCAMLQSAGIEWEIVTVAVDPRQPGVFSHVFPRAVLADGRRIALDASHGKYAGWEVPFEHRSATQVWNMAGSPVKDQDSGYRGLHGVGMGMGCASCKDDVGLGAYYAGLGQADATGTGNDSTDLTWSVDTTLPTEYGAPTDILLNTGSSSGGSVGSSGGSTSTGMTPAEQAALASLSASWTKIAGNLLAPQTTITNPNGLSVSTPANQTSALANLFGGVNLSSASTSSLLPWLLIGAAVFVVMSMGKK